MYWITPIFRWHHYKTRSWMGKDLSRLQAEVLFLLYANSERYIPREQILEFIYPDPDNEPDRAIGCIRHFIHQLRQKFGATLIITNRNNGYRINCGNYDQTMRTLKNNFLQTDGFAARGKINEKTTDLIDA